MMTKEEYIKLLEVENIEIKDKDGNWRSGIMSDWTLSEINQKNIQIRVQGQSTLYEICKSRYSSDMKLLDFISEVHFILDLYKEGLIIEKDGFFA